MNLREAEATIIKAINETKLPIDVLEYILRDILNSIHDQVTILYAQEAQKAKEEEEEKESPKTKAKKKAGDDNG